MRRLLLIVTVLCTCAGCDHVTKNLARNSLAGTGRISYFGDMFRLQYAENPGAFLSMGAAAPESMRFWLLIVFIGIFLAGLLIYLIVSSNNSKPQIISLSLVAGGGVSNLFDRICNHGRVIDFMNIGIGPLRTGIFNVADLAITLGALWITVVSIRGDKQPNL